MAYTVTATKSLVNGDPQVTLTYTNGVRTVTETFSLNGSDDLTIRARNRIATLTAQDTAYNALTNGSTITPAAADPAPPALTAKQTYQIESGKLKKIADDVASGAIPASLNSAIASRKSTVAAMIPDLTYYD